VRQGRNLHDTMIWNKGGFSAVGSLSTRYAPVFEYMFILSKGKPKTVNLIKDRKNKYFGIENGTSTHTRRLKNGTTIQIPRPKVAEWGCRHNVWQISPESHNTTGHPAVFPVQLALDYILSWSNTGDTVLEPFMGSGTTGIACKKLNRNFIGIEKYLGYFKIAKKRINETIEGSGLETKV